MFILCTRLHHILLSPTLSIQLCRLLSNFFCPQVKIYSVFLKSEIQNNYQSCKSQDVVLWSLHDTQYDSDLVQCQILVCTEAKQLKVQPVKLVQFSYCLRVHFSESLESPAKMLVCQLNFLDQSNKLFRSNK